MASSPDSSDALAREAAVGDFVELWAADQRAGTRRQLADYLARFPGFEAAIAREYLAITEPPAAHSEAAPDEQAFGPYRTISLLGQGGQGSVWLAEDTRLHRMVALKVLAAPSPTLRGRIERLRREAQALARLAHPGICAIHEAQLDGPRPYLAMQLVEGETVAALLSRREADGERRQPDRTEVRAWCAFFQQAAAALHEAHQLGIVHRDIKPGNLMRTPSGAPVLLDFGFARDSEAELATLTQSGELFGTLPYMAPEVLAGRASDHRVDIYALAVTMYEVLAGQRPFVGATQAALRENIAAGGATALDRLVPGIDRQLALVVATAMELDPQRRYATAAALAADLRAVLAGEPIAATPLSGWTQLRRGLVRHPVLATSVALLAAGLLVATVLLVELARERVRLLTLRKAHVAQQIVVEQPGLALYMASEAARTEQHPEINDVLYRALDHCWEEFACVDSAARAESPWVAITADDRHLVRALESGDLQILELGRGTLVRTIRRRAEGWANHAVVGDAILAGGADGVVRRFDLATGAEVREWPLHQPARDSKTPAITHLAVAPDRQRVASCGSDGAVFVLPLDAGAPVACRGHRGSVAMAAFDPAGQRLATLGDIRDHAGDRTVRVFAADTGQLLQTFGGQQAGWVHWLSWSHDGSRLALARDRIVEVRDAVTGELVARVEPAQPEWLEQAQRVYWAAFAPGDTQLVTGSSAGLCVHDLRTGELLKQHADFGDRSVFRGAFSPDGGRLAIVAWDDTAHIYDTRSWRPLQVFRGVMTRSRGLAWNHGGTRLYTNGGCLQSWYAGERPFLPAAKGPPGQLVSARFSARGDRIVAADADGEVRVLDGEHLHELSALSTGVPLREARLLGTGSRLLLLGNEVPTRLVAGDQPELVLGTTPATAAFELDDGRIVLAGADGEVRVHDASTGALLHAVKCHDEAIFVSALHPTRHWLATGGARRRYGLVDLDQGKLLHTTVDWPAGALGDTERVLALAFAADGDELFVSCENLRLRAVELRDGFPWREKSKAATPGPLLPSPDGRTLFVGGRWSGKLYRYGARDLDQQVAYPARHSNMLVALDRQPGGHLALSASKDGLVSVFDADRDQLLSVIHASEGTLVIAAFHPDGDSILTADADGVVRIWPVDPLALALRVRPARLPDMGR